MKKIILIALILPFFFSCGYAQRIRLAINLPEGYRFITETSVNLTIEQEFMGIRYNTQMEIVTLMQMQVKGIDADSNYILSASYQKMNIHVTSLLINMEVNSESSLSADSLSLILRSLQGKEFKILLSRKGEISNITGLDEMISETIASCSLPEEQKNEFSRNLIQSLGKEAVLDNYSGNSSYYPDFHIKALDQWDFQMNLMKSGIPMELNSHIRLKNITMKTAVMVSEGYINPQRFNKEEELKTSTAKIHNLSGNEVSEVKMDIKTGLILESIVSQNVSGSIKTPSQDNVDQEIVIPFKIISRSSILTSPAK